MHVRSLSVLLTVALGGSVACTPQTQSPGPGTGGSAGAAPAPTRPPAGGSAGNGGAAGSGGSSGGSGSGGLPGSAGGSGGASGAGGGPPGAEPGPDAASSLDAAPAGGDSGVAVGPPPPAPRPFQAPGIVVYWGQNGVSRAVTDPTKHEKSLAETCRENPHYEMIVIGFIIDFFSIENVDRTPRTNFSKHCNSKMAYDADHRRLYRCDEIALGINECQSQQKKVLLSLGGADGSYRFANDDEARMFAQTTWDLFLGGRHQFRPFTTAVVDGIDLDIEGGSSTGYAAYVTRLRELMNADKSRKWYITGAPQCIFPDAYLGPAPGRALGQVPRLFDFLFVQFYNNSCAGIFPDFFMQSYNNWANVGPKILVGLPAANGAGGGFINRGALPGLLNRVKRTPAFGGVMLWDASYDQNSAEGGQTYGAFVKTQLP
jgi:chitinase